MNQFGIAVRISFFPSTADGLYGCSGGSPSNYVLSFFPWFRFQLWSKAKASIPSVNWRNGRRDSLLFHLSVHWPTERNFHSKHAAESWLAFFLLYKPSLTHICSTWFWDLSFVQATVVRDFKILLEQFEFTQNVAWQSWLGTRPRWLVSMRINSDACIPLANRKKAPRLDLTQFGSERTGHWLVVIAY